MSFKDFKDNKEIKDHEGFKDNKEIKGGVFK